MRVLVTGATGLIWRRLTLRLIDQGDSVRVLSRQPLRALPLRKLGAQVVGGDITQPRTLPHAMKDIDVVYHVAGLVGPGFWSPSYALVNVTGVANVLAAARAAGVRRVVHVSSVAAYAHPGPDTTEDAPVGPGRGRGVYAASKARGDLLAQEAAKSGGLEVAIVRPVFVYDNGRDMSDIRRWVHRLNLLPVVPLPAGGAFTLDVVHADDVAQLLALCGAAEQAPGRAYNASGGEVLSFRDLLATERPNRAHPPRIVSLPARTRQGATFPAARARAELGYEPQHHWADDPNVVTPLRIAQPAGD